MWSWELREEEAEGSKNTGKWTNNINFNIWVDFDRTFQEVLVVKYLFEK